MEKSPIEYSTGFYQFAIDSVGYGDEVYGVPYVADVIHLAGYFPEDQTAPATWSDLLNQKQPYLFAAAGGDVFESGTALVQYVGTGGQLVEDGSTSSDEALESVFMFLVDGRLRNVIPAEVLELATLESVWNALAEKRARLWQRVSRKIPCRPRNRAGVGVRPDANSQRITDHVGNGLGVRCARRG